MKFLNWLLSLLPWSKRREIKQEPSIILANLTAHERAAFHFASIPYSGDTGDARPELYHGLAPYIATFLRDLPKAIEVMRWSDCSIHDANGQWIVRRSCGEVRA